MKKHHPIKNLGHFAHKPKAAHGVTTKPVAVSGVNYPKARAPQTVSLPKLISKSGKGRKV